MTDIDHRAEAVRLVELGERAPYGGMEAYARLAQVHATLAAAASSDPPWTTDEVTAMEIQLRELRAAVRPAFGYLDQTSGGRAIAMELRKLVPDA